MKTKFNQANLASIYQCRVSLKGILPPIWRRIQIPGDLTLYELHQVLQVVMGWENYHLYEFIINGVSYGDPASGDGDEIKDARRTRVAEVVAGENSKFIYIYDFGDDWQHVLKVEKLLPPNPQIRRGICLAGKRACPPEDCGGPWGYLSLLEALQDPEHEEHEAVLEWVGDDFDPEEFDKESINRILQQEG